MTGRIFSGDEAFAYGFATSLHADPLAAARSTAKEIAGRSPEAVRAVKRLLNPASDATPQLSLSLNRRAGDADRLAKPDRGGERRNGKQAGTVRGSRMTEADSPCLTDRKRVRV